MVLITNREIKITIMLMRYCKMMMVKGTDQS